MSILHIIKNLLRRASRKATPQEIATGPKKRSKYFIAFKKNDGLLNETVAALDKFVPFIAPLERFYADPMLFKHAGVNYVFFEDYDYKKGVIAYSTIGSDMSISKPVLSLELDCHLSFPHVFEDGGSIYMTPETYDYKEVGLYKATSFPTGWEKQRVIVSGEDFSDPVIFKYNNYYWLFASVRTTLLRIYFAETLDGKFQPHPINKLNIEGRNAGRVFYQDKKLIRPVMDCTESYGHAMILKEIVTLNPMEFVEKDILSIEPNWAPDLDGTHTFNLNDDLITYDGRRTILVSEDEKYSA